MKTLNTLAVALVFALAASQPGRSCAAAPAARQEAAAPASDVSAQAAARILGNMEHLRGFRGTGFNFSVEVIGVENGAASEQHKLEVKVSEQGYALVEVLEPRNQRGRRTLLRERDLWLYLPSSANVIRIAPLQRVFGAASIADVLNVSYLSDYTVESSRKAASGPLLQLSLKSKDARSTYARIEVDYDLAADRPVESRHYTASNRLLKTIQYKTFHKDGDSPKVEKIVIVDGIRKSSAVWMKMGQYSRASYTDAIFSKAALSGK